MRGRAEARDYLGDLPRDAVVSTITVAELFVGIRDGEERKALEAMMATFRVLPLDAALAAQGGLLRREFGKSHGVGLNDALIGALIGATALAHCLTLATLNITHYPMLRGAQLFQPYLKH